MSTKHSSNIILVQMVFGNLETGGNVLLGEQWFPPCYPTMHTILVQCFPEGGLMNTDSQCKRDLQILRRYPGVLCDLLDYCTPCSWSDFRWTTAPGKSNNSVEFSPFEHYLPDSGLAEPNLFRNGFVTLSRPMSIDDFS